MSDDRMARVDAVLLSRLTTRHAPLTHHIVTAQVCHEHGKYPPSTELVPTLHACPDCHIEEAAEDHCGTCKVPWPCPDAADLLAAGAQFSPRH